jgi:hypothetical protein
MQSVKVGDAVDAEDDGDSGNRHAREMQREFVGHGQ